MDRTRNRFIIIICVVALLALSMLRQPVFAPNAGPGARQSRPEDDKFNWNLSNAEPVTIDAILDHTNFAAALVDGAEFDDPALGRIIIERQEMGTLKLPTGKIVACDPASKDAIPFVGKLPPGEYKVLGSIAKIPSSKSTDERVACAVIQFTAAEPVYWHMAHTPGQDLSQMPPGAFYGFSVSTGTGSFLDDKTYLRIQQNRPFQKKITDTLDGTWQFLAIEDETANENLIAFRTGFGDGTYPCYWGISADKQVCCLAADFLILGKPLEKKLELNLQSLIQGSEPPQSGQEPKLDIRADLKWEIATPAAGATPEAVQQEVQAPPPGTFCRLRSRSKAEFRIVNAGKIYQPVFRGQADGEDQYYFRFDQPIEPKATVLVEYVDGWESLPFHPPKDAQ